MINQLAIEKKFWDDIKSAVSQFNREFFETVETIKPKDDCPLYVVKFPYGGLIGDHISQFLPLKNGEYIRLNDSNVPNYILSDLGYGKDNSPIGMIFDKKMEIYIDLPEKKMVFPFLINSPGDFFNLNHVLDIGQNINYAPNGLLYCMSGGRSCFLLPSINCYNKFSRLCRNLQIRAKRPASLYDHNYLFRQILNSSVIKSSWYTTIIYFSESWIKNIKNNPKWYNLKQYLYKTYAKKGLFPINVAHYNTSYSLLLEKNNFKPNPYIFDTFKYLIQIICGHSPGFTPLTDEDLLPLNVIQNVFRDYYDLDSMHPTIIGPSHFNPFADNPDPVYYSLQVPTMNSFSPKSKKASTMVELKELSDLCKTLLTELSSDTGFCSNTIIQYVAKHISPSYHHNSKDIDNIILSTNALLQSDSRFKHFDSQSFAENGKFFRGCVKIQKA